MARLGNYASQKGLDVTGNNISNINTTGYTRQVLDQISLRVGGKDRYSSTYDSRTGSGTLVTGISQIRDPYLDIRFRTEQASVGAMDAKLAGLEDLAGVLDDLQSLLLLVAEWFTRLIPVFVFIIIVKSFWLGQMSEILPAWKSWAVTSGLQATALLVMALQICRKNKVRLSLLLKKVSATFLIALGTNSCAASTTENYACCGGKLGIDGKVFGFGIPIGTSIFKPSSAIRLIVLVFYMASTYQVGVSAEWFVMAILMTVMLSIAVPAIPGGTLMFCPMLFAQLGLPAEALTPMLATDIFFDAVCTAFNQVSVQMALIQQADVLGMLERDALRQ